MAWGANDTNMARNIQERNSSDEESLLGDHEVWDADELEDIVQIFHYNTEEIIAYNMTLDKYSLCFELLCPCGYAPCLCCFGPVHALFMVTGVQQKNMEDAVRAHNVAVTKDNVLYVKDKHKNSCRQSCCITGKFRKTIQLEKISDIQINEPAGRTCCGLVEEKLTTVDIQTASSPGVELRLEGLDDSVAFRKLIFQLKKGGGAVPSRVAAATAPAQQAMAITGGGHGGPQTVAQLNEMNKTLKNIEALLAK